MRAPTKYCDLVMKGGITSGLVYPSAVLELATAYRFKNIGGTSAGAIAAAMAAAAALGERRLVNDGQAGLPGMGMDGLAAIAADLGRPGFIYGLFQPTPVARAAYRLIVRLAAGPSVVARFAEGVLALLRLAPVTMLFTLLLLLGTGWLAAGVRGTLAALLPALVCALAAGAWRALWVTAHAAGDNFMGLCSGLGGRGAARPALTEWMHDGIRALAGLDDAEGRPVTFGDLWQAPAYADEPESARRIDLAIITTNISHAEPRTLPFAKGGFFFREDEFRRLFPAAVVDWMVAHSPKQRDEDGHAYHHLPEAARMPIVVAARMSLSFPLLISAIPLHELDVDKAGAAAAHPAADAAAAEARERPRFAESVDALAAADQIECEADGAATLPLRRCWFTDGGVSSNFPIHLFDAPLPRWPTFAIDLVYSSKQPMPDPIFLPTHNNAAMRPRYREITGKGPISDLSGFFFGIIGTMQNWRDLLQGRAPGHRDRIVRIALDADEGGMNLDMPEAVLGSIAGKGRAAGARLIADFDFDNHFWIRYRNVASAAERFTITFGDALAGPLNADNARAFERLWSRDLPTAGPYRFSKAQADEAVTRLERIRNEAASWKDAAVDLTEGAPKPLPQLRVVPTF
ncbi:patatin-like phospholipase family protein [Sphingomonas sanxanigenens]|uniref:PNPLA domain-containing protein n=1 Tax=Sphingomonas sanxanigenens DSM 19645 = NX02 TaxID=1123269 RepID=W0AFD3_9SPHN|nr:patatin-like phospholipase family protein [Sphingomonas sanxanigenens]AHE55247.1 hypothetical protein NX02_17865 [Sphingomonas sanxanigenens DSM 19645 = NX02]